MVSSNLMLKNRQRSITNLEQYISELDLSLREVFYRIFDISASTGYLHVPRSFKPRAQKYFSSNGESVEEVVEKISSQVIVKTSNKFTLEGALFNELRTCKPGTTNEAVEETRKKVFEFIDKDLEEKGCDFCKADRYTPKDLPLRLRGSRCITAANVAKYDATHGLVIFGKHNPFDFSFSDFSDFFDLGFQWFREMHNRNTRLVYPFLMWNCMPRAGASLIHGHIQVLITDEMPYRAAEQQRTASMKYRKKYGSDYFKDLFLVHEALGFGFRNSSNIMAYLTPTKDKEVLILSNNPESLKDSVYKVIRCFIDRLGVFSFNLGVDIPPIMRQNGRNGWHDFPYVARVVDRGNPLKAGGDIGSMELYGSPVIGFDPFKVISEIKTYILSA